MKYYVMSVLVMLLLSMTVSAQMKGDAVDFSPVQYERDTYGMEMKMSRGGQLYDNWWRAAVDAEKPEEDHPLWKTQSSNTRTGYSTYRCKECHGWDYRGKDGAYGSGSHYTGFGGALEASKRLSEKEITGVLKGSTNSDHDFSMYLNDEDVSDLVLFLKRGLIDMVRIVNAEGVTDKGKELYSKYCMTECHGPDGTALNFGSEEKPEFVGTIANKNPWEFIHKVRAGQPGTRMSSGIMEELTSQELRDLLAYAQTLPEEAQKPGWFGSLKELFGSKKQYKSIIPEQHRGFGPKKEQ